jgi:hypothetical protein
LTHIKNPYVTKWDKTSGCESVNLIDPEGFSEDDLRTYEVLCTLQYWLEDSEFEKNLEPSLYLPAIDQWILKNREFVPMMEACIVGVFDPRNDELALPEFVDMFIFSVINELIVMVEGEE